MILELDNVSVAYGATRIIHSVTLGIERGEFVSLIGPNGAGKTTLLNAISGQLPLSSGQIHYHGKQISNWKADRRSRSGIGRSFQTIHLFPNLTVTENVWLAMQARKHIKWTTCLSKVRQTSFDVVFGYLQKVRLENEAMKSARLLSHGDKRKLEIAMLLALEPSVLLLDEPTAGMAASAMPEMLTLIQELKESQAFTIVLVEHKLDVVMQLSNRIIVLKQGSVLADGSPAEVIQNTEVQEAYIGGSHEQLT